LQARTLLEAVMFRRIKAQVEASLLPKLEYKVYVPLTPLQRVWYQRVLTVEEGMEGLFTAAQLMGTLQPQTLKTPKP
jgi:SNF2 family DNA or RNA helicase